MEDWGLSVVGVFPYRCRGCNHRFHSSTIVTAGRRTIQSVTAVFRPLLTKPNKRTRLQRQLGAWRSDYWRWRQRKLGVVQRRFFIAGMLAASLAAFLKIISIER
ncbi:MAG: hypothetical protein FJW40_02905 [Acidobacteria bacterium]|nr:hypothetical protein [Acidobacteriota bacterium]